MSNFPAPGVYNIDPVHSNVGFIARHLVASKVRGNFAEFSGVITIGDTPETSSVHATVQASSITTNNEMRDGHLKSADFLDLANYPTLELVSTKLTPKGDNYELVANLTVKGITKPVIFTLEFLGEGPSMTPGVNVAGFEATGEIDRRDFGVNFEGNLENGSLIVGNKIVLELAVEASRVPVGAAN
ncbi:MAG: YceI family protein [Acidimicrobiales bacterium]|jgi:polyisoprenoid-binding protein YceI